MSSHSENEKTSGDYELVYTVTNYWDGPREGVADYSGRPYYFKCIFDSQKDEWSSDFLLRPLDSETFKLALESWQMWLRWKTKYDQGQVPLEGHPVLPDDRPRYIQISDILTNRLVVDPLEDLIVKGEFEMVSSTEIDQRTEQRWRVKWSTGLTH